MSTPTTRVSLTLDGERFDYWTRIEIVRHVGEIAGSFEVECTDLERNRQAFPEQRHAARWATIIRPGMKARLNIDNELVLVGWVDDVAPAYTADKLGIVVTGRDATGDLVDCAANPSGPNEYRNLSLTEICTRLCRPFGIPVRAEVPVGDRFPLFSIDIAETVMSAIEKACRQRAILAVSDGVGGLLLTQGGGGSGGNTTRPAPSPAPLRWGENVLEAQGRFSWRDRYSSIAVKGQGGTAAAADARALPLTPSATPAATPPAAPTPSGTGARARRAAISATGRATDATITRYRPHVAQAKTQSGGASVQRQAEWQVRIARAKGSAITYVVQDWRAGEKGSGGRRRLWRPNEVVLVDDAYLDLLEEMLVAGVVYSWGPEGAQTKLDIVGRHALDLVEEGGDRRRQRANPALDSRALGFNGGS